MRRRRFGKAERFALWAADDGRCAECGRVLEAGWHADHVFPFSKGGATDVTNGRATCPTCNLQKGARSVPQKPLHNWQKRALDKWTAHDLRDFLMEATPGAGKTRVEAEISARELESSTVERVIVVVPTSSLRDQTARAFNHWTGLQLDPTWDSGSPFPRRPFVGVVVTYQAVDMAPENFRTFTKRAPTLSILDEIHHAGDKGSWSASLRHAFEPAKKRLLSSGTPFRSDNQAIPFVRYDNNEAIADFSISYGEALQEGVVRSVYFPRCGGIMEWAASGKRYNATFDDDLDELGQSRRLRTALIAEGGHLSGLLRDAHKDLMEKRSDDPDAGGLVVTIDQLHAQSVALAMRRILGVDPIVVISDDKDAKDKIDAFAASTVPWVVAVRMVSEGVDIPRLRVGAYATNIVTEMYFRQFIGRFVRRQEDHEDHSAAVFIPDDPRLREYAQKIQEQRKAVLEEENKREPRDFSDRPASTFVPLSSTMNLEGMIVTGEGELSPRELDEADRIRRGSRELSSLPLHKIALILRAAGLSGAPAGSGAAAEETTDEPLAKRLKTLRTQNNKVVAQIHYAQGAAFADIHNALNNYVGHRGRLKECADIGQLERRLAAAIEWLAIGSDWVLKNAG